MKDEIEIFLTSPIAFTGGWSTRNSTISVLERANEGVRVNGKNERPSGILVGWGVEKSVRERYYYGSSNTHMTRRKIEGFKKNGQEVELKITKVKNFKIPGHRQYFNTSIGKFAELIQRDKKTIAFLESIPGLEEKFKQFVNDTMHWWIHNEQTLAQWAEERPQTNPGNLFISSQYSLVNDLCEINDLLTKDNMVNLEARLCAILEDGTKEETSSYKLKTFSKIGIKNGPGSTFLYQARPRSEGREQLGPYEDRDLAIATDDNLLIKSWKSDNQNKVKNLKAAYQAESLVEHSDFTVNFKINPEVNYKIYARFGWKKVKYTHEKTVTKRTQNDWQGQARTVYDTVSEARTIFLPVIDSLCLEILPPEGEEVNPHYREMSARSFINNRNGLYSSDETGFSCTRIERVFDATKKRASKGGYKGGYQGIEQLSIGTTPAFSFITKSNFSDIAGSPAIRSYSSVMVEKERTVPLTMEQYMGIERPEVDVKPIEIGHLNLMRLSDPPKRLVIGDSLSDLLLPSMPALIIAVDTDLKVTNGTEYRNGLQCSGDCAKSETVDEILPPGLYLVERKLKCALGHDPGRAEYTAGFGDICNEVITIRNMLSRLNIAYDEFRGNMVGTSRSNKFAETKLDSGAFLGRLG